MKRLIAIALSLATFAVIGAPSVGYQAATNIAARVTSNVVTKAYVEGLGISGGGGVDTNAVKDIVSYKRDLTNNVCTVDSFTVWNATLQSGYTFGDEQPTFDSENRKWKWYVEGEGVAVDAESGTSTANATSATFTFDDNGTTVTFTATRAKVAYANQSFVTHGYVGPTISNVVYWENYWLGNGRVRLSVTNANSSTVLPRFRIQEAITNTLGEIAFWNTVWDEEDRHTNYQAQVDAKVDAIETNVLLQAYRQTNNQLANKAPKAWGSVTSAGEQAPANTVWMTEPETYFAGGTEYTHVAVGEGTICVLATKGAGVYTEGEEGTFRFMDSSGDNYFGFDVRSSYTIGCRTDGITTTKVGNDWLVTLTYDLTSSVVPIVLTCTNLTNATWNEATVEWEQNPPAGTMVCDINCGSNPQGFFKSEIRYAGGSKFLTNMQADLMGGIAATNETLNVIQSVEPYISNGTVLWRIKQ